MLSAARHTARSKFDANRSLLPGSAEAENAREHAEKVATILRKNIVQGQQVGGEVEKYRQSYCTRQLRGRVWLMLGDRTTNT